MAGLLFQVVPEAHATPLNRGEKRRKLLPNSVNEVTERVSHGHSWPSTGSTPELRARNWAATSIRWLLWKGGQARGGGRSGTLTPYTCGIKIYLYVYLTTPDNSSIITMRRWKCTHTHTHTHILKVGDIILNLIFLTVYAGGHGPM